MGKEWAAMKEQLRETLDKVSLTPMRECEQEAAAVLIGAVGLELYAAYSKLIQMEMEFCHAKEYLDSGRRADVEETMQINGETFARMRCKFEKRSGELLECGDKDEEFRKPVSAFLQALAEEAKCLEKYRLGEDAAGDSDRYLDQMRGMAAALREYLGLCIGSTTVWEKK